MTEAVVVPTLHPAFLLHGAMQYREVVTADLGRARRIAEDGYVPCVDPLPLSPKSSEADWLRGIALLDQWLRAKATVAIDTETTGVDRAEAVDPYRCGLKSVAVAAYGQDWCLSFPIREMPARWRPAVLGRLRAICDDPDIMTVFHNFSFDTPVLRRHGFPVRGPIGDSILLHHVLEPDLEHDLGFVAQLYLDVPAWKELFRERGRKKNATLEDLLYYNALDAGHTIKLFEVLYAWAVERGALGVYEGELDSGYLARRLEQTGIPIHVPTMNKFERLLLVKRDAAAHRIKELCGRSDLRLTTHKDVEWLFYEHLRLPVRKYTKVLGQRSTSYKAVLEFLDKEIIRQFVSWSEAAHDLSTFINGYRKRLRRGPLGAMWLHPSWNVTGQVGTRFSSYPNVQNVPEHLRAMVRAPAGYRILWADQAALEYRLMAVRAGARRLLEIFNSGGDAHSVMGERIFGARWRQLGDEMRKQLRTLVKRVVYALNYGAEPPKITSSLREDRKLPLEVRQLVKLRAVAEIKDGFLKLNHEIPTWWQACIDFVNRFGYLEIPPDGRRRYYPRPVEPNKAKNWPIQTEGGTRVNRQLVEIDRALPPDCYSLINGHDAGVWLVKEPHLPRVERLVDSQMREHLEGPAGSVELFAESKSGQAWYEAAKWPK